MPNNFPTVVKTFIVATTFISFSTTAHAASVVKSNAYVNILSGSPDIQDASGINPVVMSSAIVEGGKGSAFAKAEPTKLRSQAAQATLGLSFPAAASSVFENSFGIFGNPNNTPLPLTFNFSLTILRTELGRYDAIGAEVFKVRMGFNQGWVQV